MRKTDCKCCGVEILRSTADKTGGSCMPCFKQRFDEVLFDNDLDRHQKIQKLAVECIHKRSGPERTWRFTLLGRTHPEVSILVRQEEDELAIASCFISEDSWYYFSTQRMVGRCSGRYQEYDPREAFEIGMLMNYKGYGGLEVETLRMRGDQGLEASFEFETGFASMVPIYCVRFWQYVYPRLQILKG
jgi:hypothetical protein